MLPSPGLVVGLGLIVSARSADAETAQAMNSNMTDSIGFWQAV